MGGTASSAKAEPMSTIFAVAGALEHDVGRLDVAVDNAVAVQGGKGSEAFADNVNGDACLDARLDGAAGDDDVV